MSIRKIKIHICSDGTNDSLFICGVYGEVTINELDDINNTIIDDAPGHGDFEAGIHIAECTYNEEERGEYGRIEHDAYWDIDFIGFEPSK